MQMSSMLKTVLTSIIAMTLCITFAIATDAQGSQLKTKKIYFNNEAVTFPVIEQNGYQLVPATLFRQLGATVEWNNEDRAVHIVNGQYKVRLPIGKTLAKYKLPESNEWYSDYDVNIKTRLEAGKSYIPLAYTATKLGIEVKYDANLKAAKLFVDYMPNLAISQSNLSEDDIYWLYRLTEAEAGGESYEGKLAVAATVLNRVEHEDWPNTAVDTIFEIVNVNGTNYYQFEPVLNKYIYDVSPSEQTIEAVHTAINGADPTNGAVVFYNPEKTTNKWVLSRPIAITIGNHVFAY